jgi:hypothetical protein
MEVKAAVLRVGYRGDLGGYQRTAKPRAVAREYL